MKDIGILASTDPVALDQACLDLVYAVKPTEGNDNRPLVNRIESFMDVTRLIMPRRSDSEARTMNW